MLIAAALVPDTALLVPGVAGAADPVPGLRAAALDAVSEVLTGARHVVVVAPGRQDRELTGAVRGSFAAVGVPDTMLRWPVPERTVGTGTATVGPAPGTGSVVALHLLARAGWTGELRVVEVTPDGDHCAVGRDVVSGADVALVVVGSGSGRHGPDAPLADDERAPEVDARMLADLADAGPAARARLAALDRGLAGELAVSGWAPWQVLLAAVGDSPVSGALRAAQTPSGAQHAVLVWSSGALSGAGSGPVAG